MRAQCISAYVHYALLFIFLELAMSKALINKIRAAYGCKAQKRQINI